MKTKLKNQHQEVLWYLLNWKFPFSLTNVINDSNFYKFQTRLGELESKHGILTNKKRVKFINRFHRNSSFIVYKCINTEKVKELFNDY